MKKDLDDLLCSRYPRIFKDRGAAYGESNMHFGFEMKDGWFAIIDGLCAAISGYEATKVDDETYRPVIASQVKQKFGNLCFYYNGGDAHVRELVAKATNKAETTCEICGVGEASLVKGFVVRTACSEHADYVSGHIARLLDMQNRKKSE